MDSCDVSYCSVLYQCCVYAVLVANSTTTLPLAMYNPALLITRMVPVPLRQSRIVAENRGALAVLMGNFVLPGQSLPHVAETARLTLFSAIPSLTSAMSMLAAFARVRVASTDSLSLARVINPRHAASLRLATVHRQTRSYAKPVKKGGKAQIEDASSGGKRGKGTTMDELIPASQRVVQGAEYKSAEGKMQTVLEWFRKEVATLETRATGRVTPAVLAPVRVRIPDAHDSRGVRLEEVATVGVREGTMLLVTVFEEHVSLVQFFLWNGERTLRTRGASSR